MISYHVVRIHIVERRATKQSVFVMTSTTGMRRDSVWVSERGSGVERSRGRSQGEKEGEYHVPRVHVYINVVIAGTYATDWKYTLLI